MSETCFVSESESALLRERQRLGGLMRACRRHGLDDKYDAYVKADLTESDVDNLASGQRAASARISAACNPRVEVTVDSRDKFVKDMNDSLALRAGLMSDRSRAGEISHPGSLPELARKCLLRTGASDRGLSTHEVIERALSHSTSDLPNLLSGVVNKSLGRGYESSPATWRPLATLASVRDFKEVKRVGLGQVPDLEETKELAPMSEFSLSEKSASYSIATFARRVGISRQMIINDDLGGIARIPEELGRAAARVPAKLFYDLLVSSSGTGPVMDEDSKHLFDTTHAHGANYIEAVGPISISTLAAAMALLRKQAGLVPDGETPPTLNLRPAYLLVPSALEAVALQYTTQITPAASANVLPSWMPGLQVICEPRLDSATNGGTAWYLVAPPSQISCVEVAFLNGVEVPNLIQVQGGNVLGIEYACFTDVGVKWLDARGWFRQRGA